MVHGKVKNLIPLLKDIIINRIEQIDFTDQNFATYEIEEVSKYVKDRLDLINGIYQDYLTENITLETSLSIDLKNNTYRII